MNRGEQRAAWLAGHRGESSGSLASGGSGGGPARPSINLHVDELRLEGFPRSGRNAIGDAMQVELTALLVDRGLPAALREAHGVRVLATPEIQVSPASGPAAIGRAIANSVYRGGGK